MTTRSRSHFNIISGSEWTDHKGHRYSYATLNQIGFNAKQEGTVGKQYTVRLGSNPDKLDAPEPPFSDPEGGHWDKV